ncbi:MAG: GNAT family N-acetyltransferase, partial [Bacteroidota bacterium]
WGYSPEQILSWDEDLTITGEYIAQHQVWKWLEGEKLVAYSSWWKEADGSTYLDNLFLHPEQIGKGLGKIVLLDALAKMAADNCHTVRLDADPHAEAFYRHQGFAVIGQLPSSIPGRFLPIMEKGLTDFFATHILHTPRLSFRNLQRSDLHAFHDMQSNPKVMQFIKAPLTWAESRSELLRFMECHEQPFFRFMAVVEKGQQELIGMCGAYLNQHDEIELAWRLREQFWGKRYGWEMATAFIQFLFQQHPSLQSLFAYAHPDNIGSIRILEAEMEWVEDLFLETYQMPSRKFQLERHSWHP